MNNSEFTYEQLEQIRDWNWDRLHFFKAEFENLLGRYPDVTVSGDVNGHLVAACGDSAEGTEESIKLPSFAPKED